IGAWRENKMAWLDGNQTDVAMTTKQIDDLIKREQSQKAFAAGPRRTRYDRRQCNCPVCRAERAAQFGGGGMPPDFDQMIDQMPPELIRMMEELGPEEMIGAIEEILGG